MSDIILSSEVFEPVRIKRSDGKILAEFSFNPSDSNIVERYEEFIDGFKELADKIRDYEIMKEDANDLDSKRKAMKEISEEICRKVDKLLNEEVSGNIFSVMGPLSPLPSGDYYFAFIIEQISKKIKNSTGHRMKKMEMKINKHTSKYHG